VRAKPGQSLGSNIPIDLKMAAHSDATTAPFRAVATPSRPIKFLINGAEINERAPSRRIKHEGRWLYRQPIAKKGEASFTTKPIANVGKGDVTWVRQSDWPAGELDRAPVFCAVPLKQHLLGVWMRGRDTFLVLSIPERVRPLVNVEMTGDRVPYARFYVRHNEYNNSCFSTYTEYNFPPGVERSEDEWDNATNRFIPTDHPLTLLWWRDEEAKATLAADLSRYKGRYDEYIAALVSRNQAAQGVGMQLLLGGEACCALLSCEPCIVPLCRLCECAPYQHHWFFRHHGVEVNADPSATAMPTSYTRGDTTTCKWSWAQCCCPLWPLLPCICICVGSADEEKMSSAMTRQ